jgi:hypothetical protein
MFLMQDGHQAASRVAPALEQGSIDGVIWSPGDQTPDGLAAQLNAYAGGSVVQAIDPQMYVAALQDANPKKLGRHGLFSLPMGSRDYSTRRLEQVVIKVLELQGDAPTSHLLSPTVAVSSMGDRSAQVALTLAETSLETWADIGDDRPLFVSSAIDRSLLADEDSVNSLLDELSALECDGFYLLFELPPRLDPAQLEQHLARAMYIVYVLGELNGYDVWTGYSGLTGYLMRAAGASAFGGGFFQKQQWWATSHWTGSGGGRQPRPRIALDTILGSLLIDAELGPLLRQRRDADLAETILLSRGEMAEDYRARGSISGAEPDRARMTAQLLAVCRSLDSRISGDVSADLRRVREAITDAQELHRRISAVNVQLEPDSAPTRLGIFAAAIASFGARAGLTV